MEESSICLNSVKTKYILFSPQIRHKPRRPLNFEIKLLCDTDLEQVNQTRYLGVTFDSELFWSTHINQICKKIAQSAGLIKKTCTICKWKDFTKHIL